MGPKQAVQMQKNETVHVIHLGTEQPVTLALALALERCAVDEAR